MTILEIVEIFFAVIGFFLLHFLGSNDGLPKNWPIVGMIPDLLWNVDRINERVTEILQRTGCNFLFRGMWFSNMDMLMTADPANTHYILSANFANFPKGARFLKIFDILGDGIFNADSDLWKNQRRIAHTLMNHRRFQKLTLKTTTDKVKNGLLGVLEHVAEGKLPVVDLQDVFQRFTFDVTCMLVTGYDPGCLSSEFPEVGFSKAMDDAEEALLYRQVRPEWFWKLQGWLGMGEEKKLKQASITLDRIVSEYISKKRKQLRDQPVKYSTEAEDDGGDLLTSYMTGVPEFSETKPSEKFLRDTIINFLLAGRDTTSSALAWFFWLLSENPQVEDKIREELIRVAERTPKDEEEIEENRLLVYLHGALCESLRLYPPVPFQQKEPSQPDELPSGHHVHPKMKIVFSLYAMGRMRSIWGDDCLEFKPERWITEGGKIKHEPSYKFLAFNAGPRTCLGKEVAFRQMKSVAKAIICNYHIKVLERNRVCPSASIILHIKHGLPAMVTKRNEARST